MRSPYFEVAFAFLATLALLAAAWWVSRDRRTKTALVLESACWTHSWRFPCRNLAARGPA